MPRIKITDIDPIKSVPSEHDLKQIKGGALNPAYNVTNFGRSRTAKGGNVEFEWKVEEGES